jgi:hypothetical protein
MVATTPGFPALQKYRSSRVPFGPRDDCCRDRDPTPELRWLYSEAMERPGRFEANRFLGDKRLQAVYDLDDVDDDSVINELAASSHTQTFGPDTLAEARNRGYRLRRV